jgi:hypothetical protein
MSTFTELWKFFGGHIRCINLITRKDRYKESLAVFNEFQIPVTYFLTTKHPNGGGQGCFESHIQIIREAYFAGAERVLIFEDDIIASKSLTPARLEKAINFMKTANNWEIFYLGVLPRILDTYSARTKQSGIYQLRGICTHGYVINRSAMEKLIHLKYEGITIDYYYINCFSKTYAIYPTLFYQGLSDSDITTSTQSYKKYLNKDKIVKFYRFIEWYAYYINIPVRVLVPILMVVIIWFLFRFHKKYKLKYLVLIVLVLFVVRNITSVTHRNYENCKRCTKFSCDEDTDPVTKTWLKSCKNHKLIL